MRRIVVTGLGAVTPLGVGMSAQYQMRNQVETATADGNPGVKRAWNRLLDGETGIAALTHQKYAGLPCRVAAAVPKGPGTGGGWTAGEWLAAGEDRRMATFTQYAIAAAQEALDDACWMPKTEEERQTTGVCLGSGIGSLDDVYDTSVAYEKGGYKKISPLFVPRLLINMAAGHISIKFNLKGPTHAPTTACTTGAHSIISASHLIALGHADVVLAGASESCIHPLAIAGFARAKSLSTSYNTTPHLSSRPFDKNRDGFVIGEGAGVLVLEELNHALTRHPRPKIYAELTGSGSSSDAHHITAPHPTGHGAYTSMRLALNPPLSPNPTTPPSEVSYVNAHATSTPLGDTVENTAIKNLLLHSPHGHLDPKSVNISSTKGATGHLLGAAGALEAIFTVLAVRENVIPPTLNLYDVSSEDEFSCNYVPHTAQERWVGVALSNSFGFGGTNASLCFRKLKS